LTIVDGAFFVIQCRVIISVRIGVEGVQVRDREDDLDARDRLEMGRYKCWGGGLRFIAEFAGKFDFFLTRNVIDLDSEVSKNSMR
jgi:hypothetical protein